MALTLNHSHNVFVVSKEPTPDLNQQVTQRVVLSIIFAVYDHVRLVATYTENSPPFVERHLAPKPATMGLQFAWQCKQNVSWMGRKASHFQWDNNTEKLFWLNSWTYRVTRVRRLFSRCLFRSCFPPCESNLKRKDWNSRSLCGWKTRVAPIKSLRIPILELQAELLAAWLRCENPQALHVSVQRTSTWADCTTVLQWLHSIDKKRVLVPKFLLWRHWTNGPTSQQPTNRQSRALAACRRTSFYTVLGSKVPSSWWILIGLFSRQNVSKLRKFYSNELISGSVNQVTTANTASVASNVRTLEWQTYRSYENFLRIVAYLLRDSQKFPVNRPKTIAITDPVELENSEQKLFFLVQSESFRNKTKASSSSAHWASLP